jgi:hypothetical protein
VTISPESAWVVIAAILSAFLLITDVILRISALKTKAQAPDIEQNRRIKVLEDWREKDFEIWKQAVDRKLENDNNRFKNLDESNHVTMVALIALLDHGIAGNNVHQMEEAKAELAHHLANKQS